MENGKIKIGICVMEKKVPSMKPILDRLESYGVFEIIHFRDKVILEDSIDCWPICDCLIAFFSSGFPLEKAEEYAALRQPFLVNELKPQHRLHDRRKVYKKLIKYNILVPPHAVVNREFPYQELDNFVEEDDFVEINGYRVQKPFVEKPVHGEDHRVMIYYPISAGGGMKELFRKVGNQSSQFHPGVKRVRRDGSFIYEKFMTTGGTDVKVYTVGPYYAHAEARKSPVVDGIVMRNPDGKEVRYPVLLTPQEKKIAREISCMFKQEVCGFDILRCEGISYVCDVNGWSFVKNSEKYYDDAAFLLRQIILDAKAPHLSATAIPTLPWKLHDPIPSYSTFGQSEELRCVVGIVRHGDMTPKQKIKLKITEEELLNVMLKYNGGRSRSEAKLKTSIQLQDILEATRILVAGSSDREAVDTEHVEKLRQVKAVLEEGGFSGIYRKVQLKPSKWTKIAKTSDEGEVEQPVEAIMVLKYGGVLTHAGEKQAEELGKYFRDVLYPGTGLIRLHSTFCHNLEIYSSDEGRVQMSAAAFAKGLLNLEGQLTPILVSLVSKDSSMLDGLENASIEITEAKARLFEMIISGAKEDFKKESSETPWMADGAGLPSNAFELLQMMVQLTKEVSEQLRLLAIDNSSAKPPCGSEGFFLMLARWQKLATDFYNEHEKLFEISKIADVYDSCKYDLLHNAHLKLYGLVSLFKVAQSLSLGVIPNEYGINPRQKLKIGSKVACGLLGKIMTDLKNAREKASNELSTNEAGLQDHKDSSKETEYCLDRRYSNVRPEKRVWTRLYFTSESHIHSLVNVLRYCNLDEITQGEDCLVSNSGLERLYKAELDYMSSVVFRMFENPEVSSEDPKRYRIELKFSCGADLSPLENDYSEDAMEDLDHTLPIKGLEPLQEEGSYLTLERMEKIIRPFLL